MAGVWDGVHSSLNGCVNEFGTFLDTGIKHFTADLDPGIDEHTVGDGFGGFGIGVLCRVTFNLNHIPFDGAKCRLPDGLLTHERGRARVNCTVGHPRNRDGRTGNQNQRETESGEQHEHSANGDEKSGFHGG